MYCKRTVTPCSSSIYELIFIKKCHGHLAEGPSLAVCGRQDTFQRNLSPAFLIFTKILRMKKLVLLILVLVVAGLVAWKLMSKKEAPGTAVADQALKISKNTGTFNTAFAALMNDY